MSRWMALLFAVGSLCFLIGPFPGYAELVGPGADAVTFFVGSIFFTGGGALQLRLSLGGPRAEIWVAAVQSAGTLFFNVTTFAAMHTALTNPEYDRLVWRPDAFGSICFLISGAIGYAASQRQGWLPARSGPGWWQPGVNLLGCIFFGIAAVAGYVVGSSPSPGNQAAANLHTAARAARLLPRAVGRALAQRSGAARSLPLSSRPTA